MSEATIPNEVMISAEKLRKSFGEFEAVKGIDFNISRGEVVGFLGPNGAGKSTTMKMLTGFLNPDGGRATIGGVAVAKSPKVAQANLGYLPENAPMYEDMMVVDFLHFIADVRGVSEDIRKKRMREIGERCGVMDVLGKDLGQLSKGYRQRVGLAQAMIHDPDLLILDEPTSGLDPNQIIEIRELIKELGREKTILLSTHILPEVEATCGRIIIINEGKLVADEATEALMARQSGTILRVTMCPKNGTPLDGERMQGLLVQLPGVLKVLEVESNDLAEHERGYTVSVEGREDPRADIFNTVVDENAIILDMYRERISLEDTFRQLTRAEEV
ncbi:MAG: ATP-binding cassette domain-containing protein [Myxococcota bacterium]|nr:ATP-binding cassette domain-containing protein [Myxococcota bacterium]